MVDLKWLDKFNRPKVPRDGWISRESNQAHRYLSGQLKQMFASG